MKLYLISQNKNNNYDTYSEAVVCVNNEEEARRINPDPSREIGEDDKWYFCYAGGKRKLDEDYSWADIKDVKVEYLGEADDKLVKGVICASFRAG